MRVSTESLILIGLGGNLTSQYGSPRETQRAALQYLEERGGKLLACSRFWRTRPVPISDQPWFVNAVAALATDLEPAALLAVLHEIEAEFGRVRTVANAARPLDLDLLAYGRRCVTDGLIVPHPRLHERAFVLCPLADIAPDWVHPISGQTVRAMIAALPDAERSGAEPEE